MQTGYARSFSFSGSLMQGSYTNHLRKPAEVMLVPMIDIFTVLVTFLLMTAVFSRLTILQLDLPSAEASGPAQPEFRLEVIVRQAGLELTDGSKPIAAIPKVSGEYDLKTLSEMAVALKQNYPKANDASVLVERDIPYDYLIQVMDAIRSAEITADVQTNVAEQSNPQAPPRVVGGARARKVDLFAHIAVGEAP